MVEAYSNIGRHYRTSLEPYCEKKKNRFLDVYKQNINHFAFLQCLQIAQRARLRSEY